MSSAINGHVCSGYSVLSEGHIDQPCSLSNQSFQPTTHIMWKWYLVSNLIHGH